ncbi:hypothetical protein GCM10027413_31150 [Conyzicola nivalis]|uniref:DUF2256 and DUF3253 domain-containing protein n=1 Tax=Conyzicola nivalis TaxID=1477021 RepID=A0A916WL68_9MICO|nr:DUF2256 and DUF3253 domain-containing protein [Conyzicola nivalis]GGB12368.1 hypothetical protein GCM10010979_28370 [Conyzicola nivalis]
MPHRQRASDLDEADAAAAEKTCASCGRRIEWRAAWAKDWDDVRYCSDACRARKVSATDRELEASILGLLATRAVTATACPSEAARAVGGESWRDLMEPARRAARRLVASGEIDITQGGSVVDPSTARGPIRLRKRP